MRLIFIVNILSIIVWIWIRFVCRETCTDMKLYADTMWTAVYAWPVCVSAHKGENNGLHCVVIYTQHQRLVRKSVACNQWIHFMKSIFDCEFVDRNWEIIWENSKWICWEFLLELIDKPYISEKCKNFVLKRCHNKGVLSRKIVRNKVCEKIYCVNRYRVKVNERTKIESKREKEKDFRFGQTV